MAAKQFINRLEALGLLSPEILEELRRHVDDSKARITAGTLARLLVDNGHLTKFQATKLISELSKDSPERKLNGGKTSTDEEDLGLAPDSSATPTNKAVILDDDFDVADELVEAVDVDVVNSGAQAAEADDIVEVEVVDVEMVDDASDEPVEVIEVVEVPEPDRMDAAGSVPVSAASGSTSPQSESPKYITPKRIKTVSSTGSGKPKSEKKLKPVSRRPLNPPSRPGDNPWDSHRILTVGVVLALLLVFAAALSYYFLRGNAEEMLEAAKDSYKPNNYEMALKKYESFLSSFPAHEEASLARVRVGMCKLRKDIESLPNPIEALKTADQVLPTIVKEPALASERGDVAGALVMLAQKFNQRADNAPDTETKKNLMTEMQRLNELLKEAQYVGNAAREQFGVALKMIEEDSRRIERDISREEDLKVSLEKIDAKLKENSTSEAYVIRMELLSRFPQLEKDPAVMARVQEAARIQQNLVVADIPEIKISAEAPAAPSTKAVSLANRAGSDVPAMAGRVICVAAKGTVYGLDGQTGNVRWKYFVGRDMIDDPLRVGDQMDSDVVVCRPELGQLTRLEGATGKVKWFSELGAPVLAPRIDGEDMLISLKSGTLLNIEPESGQIKWSARTPQPLQLTPIVNGEKPNIYVPANHSNMYVISRQDGRCKEVFYIGHREGSIVVPPVHLLGQLFIFENRTADRATIRILQTDDAGGNLVTAQEPVQIDGNIVTPPLIDGRKLVVLSDRGQIKVFDIEPSNEKDKVSVLASEVAGESKPTMTWGVTENNQLWMANYRFTRWDIQVSTGKLVRPWIQDDGDQFVGPPLKFEDVIVHRRIPRGNRGVRVTAVKADNAAVLWATDLGVPVVWLASPAAGRYDAVLATGAQFAFVPNQVFINKAESNVDSFKPGMNYGNPRLLAGGNVVLHNSASTNRMLSYVPGSSGNKLKNSSANFSTAKPTSPPAAVGDNLAFGLDNGQLLVVDPNTGGSVAKPFQPPVEPGKKHVWNQAAYLEESKSLLATDSRRKLYRLSVGESLRSLSDLDLAGTPMGPVAVIGKQVAVVLSNQTEESLLMFDATSLNKSSSVVLDGRWQSGPYNIDTDKILIQTDRKLQTFGPDGKQVWAMNFPRVRLAAPPSISTTGMGLAATNGQVWLIEPTNGSVKSELNVDQPLSAAPLAIAGGMLLGTDEGSVLLVPLTETPVAARGPN